MRRYTRPSLSVLAATNHRFSSLLSIPTQPVSQSSGYYRGATRNAGSDLPTLVACYYTWPRRRPRSLAFATLTWFPSFRPARFQSPCPTRHETSTNYRLPIGFHPNWQRLGHVRHSALEGCRYMLELSIDPGFPWVPHILWFPPIC